MVSVPYFARLMLNSSFFNTHSNRGVINILSRSDVKESPSTEATHLENDGLGAHDGSPQKRLKRPKQATAHAKARNTAISSLTGNWVRKKSRKPRRVPEEGLALFTERSFDVAEDIAEDTDREYFKILPSSLVIFIRHFGPKFELSRAVGFSAQ
jgi:hypothetical protein